MLGHPPAAEVPRLLIHLDSDRTQVVEHARAIHGGDVRREQPRRRHQAAIAHRLDSGGLTHSSTPCTAPRALRNARIASFISRRSRHSPYSWIVADSGSSSNAFCTAALSSVTEYCA